MTKSLVNPTFDFDVNALGTLNVLEAARRSSHPPSLLFTSTNKVYGELTDLRVQADGDRYMPIDERVRARGVDEAQCLDFHSPYGCSKGAAEQYVLDYSRSFGLKTTVVVEDLVDALALARRNIGKLSRRAFNIGGGPGEHRQPAGVD